MGVMGKIMGFGNVLGGAKDVAEVFIPNRTTEAANAHHAYMASLGQYAAEFGHARGGFDRFINGLNRLPRPLLALGTMGLFVYAMAEPIGFTERMKGLAYVPDALWWLLGAIVSFYFGARELHHARGQRPSVTVPLPVDKVNTTPERAAPKAPKPVTPQPVRATSSEARRPADPHWNAALEEWRAMRR